MANAIYFCGLRLPNMVKNQTDVRPMLNDRPKWQSAGVEENARSPKDSKVLRAARKTESSAVFSLGLE